ncbi:MAG TPA: LysM peptidoglycan-binding domain-containing protein, partial [Defluviitaleaceae bacterium]|nr:LysM peptidoglycan-binding domain-containing protein [Defluviitaleaceae bacterium]
SPQSNSDSQTSSINTSNTNQTKNNLTANQNSQANQTSQANQANRTNQTNQASQNNSSDNTQSNNDDQFTYYTVKQGDTLWSISMDFYGSGQYYKKIMQYNNMRSERELYAGKRLKIPKL